MKAAVLEKPETLALKDVPKPVCKKDEVLVRVKACGICGSDIRYYMGENPWALHTLGRHVDNPPNIILGHEFTGEVAEVGDARFEHLLGKRIFAEPYRTCGMCEFCRTGRYNLCKNTVHIGHGAGWGHMAYYPGGMAEYCQVWATHVYELPGRLTDEEATLLDPLAVAIHAVSVAGFRAGRDAFVLGAGPVGLCIALAVKAYGASRVYCSDVYAGALDTARVMGIPDALDARTADPAGYVLDMTAGRGVDAVFDTFGSAETQRQALRMLACGGTLVNLVAHPREVAYSLMDLSGERSIRGTSNNLYEDVLTGIRLMESGLIDVKPMITHRFPLEQVRLGFDTLIRKTETGAVKVLIVP